MKYLLSEDYSVRGIQYKMFAILYNTELERYSYYFRMPLEKKFASRLFYVSKKRSRFLNKYTLSILCAIYILLELLVISPLQLILLPLYRYLDGGRNFIRNKAWAQNIRFFHWANIIIILVLIILLIIK